MSYHQSQNAVDNALGTVLHLFSIKSFLCTVIACDVYMHYVIIPNLQLTSLHWSYNTAKESMSKSFLCVQDFCLVQHL